MKYPGSYAYMSELAPILIPAYKPDEKLIDLVNKLSPHPIVVVRDGGDGNYDHVFSQLERSEHVSVVRHDMNLGKGRAIKTGINAIMQFYPKAIGCVTADADGQHTPVDIFKIVQNLEKEPHILWLGVRSFNDHNIPFRSRFGNVITKTVFSFLSGRKISDVQTGLRGIPRNFFPVCMTLSGEKYEYETHVLLEACRDGRLIAEQPIQTVYLDGNRSSHFNPLTDSIRIYATLLKYGFSGTVAFAVDYLVFCFLFLTTEQLGIGFYLARAMSLWVNFFLNKNIVFGRSKTSKKYAAISFMKYLSLCLFSTTIAYIIVRFLNNAGGVPVLHGKLFIELILFFFNFWVQQKFVFKKEKPD